MPATVTTASTNFPLSYPTPQIAPVVDRCEAVARGITDDLARRAGAAGVARAGWVGVHRRAFDATAGACVAQLSELHDRLLRLAAALQADQAAADHENARRATRRAEAEAEHRRLEQATASSARAVAP